MLNRPSDEDTDLPMYVVTARENGSLPASARLFMIAPMRTLVLVLDLIQSDIHCIQTQAGRPYELCVSRDLSRTVYSVTYHAQAWQLYGDAE